MGITNQNVGTEKRLNITQNMSGPHHHAESTVSARQAAEKRLVCVYVLARTRGEVESHVGTVDGGDDKPRDDAGPHHEVVDLGPHAARSAAIGKSAFRRGTQDL